MNSQPQLVVHKFGGSSLLDAAAFAHVGQLLLQLEQPQQAIVVSAMGGVTDALLTLVAAAAAGDPDWPQQWQALSTRHLDCLQQIGEDAAVHAALQQRFTRLRHLLEGLELLGTAPREAVQLVSGLGEVCAAELLSVWFRQQQQAVNTLDAREVLVLRDVSAEQGLRAGVDMQASAVRLQAWLRAQTSQDTATAVPTRLVITGFVCRDSKGLICTLGRNGSDYSASVFAALLDASELHIWTDVDVLMSADPRKVPQAQVMPALSYREAFELAYFGASVVHPETMTAVIARNIPIYIRNTFKPELPGTRIDANGQPLPAVKGITSISDLALINIEGAGMLGVPGTAERVFQALHRAGLSVTMISQGSSEHSICFVLPQTDAALACAQLQQTFRHELELGQLQGISRMDDIHVLAAVGDGMAGHTGIAGRLFAALGRAGVNVRAIAQGSSERNVSVAVDAAQSIRALRAMHAGFYLSYQTLSIGLIGPGQVGQALLLQLAAARQRLLHTAHIDLRLRAVANSRQMLLTDNGLLDDGLSGPTSTAPDWGNILGSQGEAMQWQAFTEHVNAEHLPHAVIIDCSASDAVAAHYHEWLQAGIHVITPNKHAGSGDLKRYQQLRQSCHQGKARWRYEATVGAGLPVIQTLRDLVDSGDRITRIEGLLSGTLAWLFNRFQPGVKFSELIHEARAAGYTEPDPRDDLSGMDVARKLVIMAREMGMDITLDEVEVEALVSADMLTGSVESFMQNLQQLDTDMDVRLQQAEAQQQKLRYLARLECCEQLPDANTGKVSASVSLQAVPADHPFAHLALTDNVIAFTTERYHDNPLIIRGPGAGPEVTAAGVFADLLRIAQSLGAAI
jgi:aspartokinase/homoserine dehydrogenase 1